jgi:hypothetical protein
MPRKTVATGEATKSGQTATPRVRGRKNPNAGSRKSLDTIDRDSEAVKLRQSGMGYEDIAAQLGYANASGAWKAVSRCLKAVQTEAVDELRTLELTRLDKMQRALSVYIEADPELSDIELPNGQVVHALVPPKAQLDAMDRVMKIMDQRRRLVPQLEVPRAQEISSPDGSAPFQVIMNWPMPDAASEPIPESELDK